MNACRSEVRRKGLALSAAAIALLGLVASSQAEAPARKPQVWAMLAGVERYEDSTSFPRCRGAAHDAGALAHWLIDSAGWPTDHVLLLSDRSAEELGFKDPERRPESRPATLTELNRGVREWLTSRAVPGDVVLIYFAGQAVGLPRRPDDPAPRRGVDVLLPWDARSVDVEATGWRPGDAIEGLASSGDYSIIVAIDASPAGRVQAPRVLGDPPVFDDGARMLRGIVRWPGVTAWLAASDRPSGQDPADGAGLMTKALIASLGTRRDPANLSDCLETLRRRPELSAQRFRASGGFRPDLSLWPADVRPSRPKEEPILQRGHADRVAALEFSGDGSQLFTASRDSTVRIWDVADQRLSRVLPYALNGVWSLSRSRDGRMIAAGGGKGEVFAYDLVGEEVIFDRAPLHLGPVDRLAFLPGVEGAPRRLVSMDNRGACLFWRIEGRRLVMKSAIPDPSARLLAVASTAGPFAFALIAPDRSGAERLLAFDAEGRQAASWPVGSSGVTALALTDDGSRAFVGRDDGVVDEVALGDGKTRSRARLSAAVSSIAPCPAWLLASAGRSAWIVPNEGPVQELALERPIGRATVSADGRLVAACDRLRGDVRAWEISADGTKAEPIPLDVRDRVSALSLAFAPGGESLAAGDGSGAVRIWEIPAGRARPGMVAARGRVRHVAFSPDGRGLLQVQDDGEALLWEFGVGRGARRVGGSERFHPTGSFLPGGDLALIDLDGKVVVHDRETLIRKPVVFKKPPAADGGASSWGFHRLAVATDGRIAAGSRDGPLACVWTPNAKGVFEGDVDCRVLRGHDDAIGAAAFTAGGETLLTGSDDGTAKEWRLADPEPRLVRTLTPAGAGRVAVTAVAASPTVKGEFAVGFQDGRMLLWKEGVERPSDIGTRLAGAVHALTYSPDGAWIAAAGDDRQITLVSPNRPGLPIPLGKGANHLEMINALAFQPAGKILASAGDDSVVRLWRMADRAAIGTMAATDDGADWVVFTPQGLYDASPAGERRVAWRLDPKLAGAGGGDFVARLDQLRRQRHVFDLVEKLARAEDVEPPAEIPVARAPRVQLEPVAAVGPKQRRVELAIRLDEPDVQELRLYHNGVPVSGELHREDREWRATVTLVGGDNTLYALAGRAEGVDARSNRLDIHFDGNTAGRTHVVALGISKYQRQSLRYADVDAQAMADRLGRRDEPGETAPILLMNDDVSHKSVSEAFEQLRRRVRGRPEDRVVVFLAGHTDVREGFFCLLLHDAPMPEGPEIVAMRGVESARPAPAARPGRSAPKFDGTIIPYGVIHQNLAAIDALQRLVIIDACQAAAVFDDPVVRLQRRRLVRNMAEEEAHQARTSYILASRRGERAGESEKLKHGLLTYALLRGMGATDLGPNPDLPIFEQVRNADLDQDQWVETEELRRYVDATLPSLAQSFPELVLRGTPGSAPASPGASAQALSTDSQEAASFPLVELTAPTRTASP